MDAVRDLDEVRLAVSVAVLVAELVDVAEDVAVAVEVGVEVVDTKSAGLPTSTTGSAAGMSGSLTPVSLLTVICSACTAYLPQTQEKGLM